MNKKKQHLMVLPEHLTPGRIETPEVAVRTAISVKGAFEIQLPKEHFLSIGPDTKMTVPTAYDHAPMELVEWMPGSIGYCPPGMNYSGDIIDFQKSTWVRLSDDFFRSSIGAAFDPDRLSYRSIPSVENRVASKLIKTLGRLAEDGNASEWPLLVDTISTALSVRIAQILGASVVEEQYPSGLPRHKLKRVLDYIDSNIQRTIRLGEMAHVAGLSAYHFSRAFRRSMNISPVQYVWRRRVEQAKELLPKADLPLIVISIECGFSSQSHFSTLFKKITGMTPLQFREQFAAESTVPRRRRGIAIGTAGALAFGSWMRAVEFLSLVEAIPV